MDQVEKPSQTEEKFKKGDYSVHVYVEESKGLMPLGDSTFSNPTISVKCFGKSKCTKKLKNIMPSATSIWNEHIYFSKLNLTVAEIESERIIIEVMDTSLIRNSLIGSYELDMTYVYYQSNHCLMHHWVVLTNPYSEDISVMKGVVKIGVNVLHEADKAEDLAKPGNDSIAVPPQIKLKTVQLVIQILKAENLPIMDRFGTIDAYCLGSFGNAEQRTSVIQADVTNLSVYWFEEILLPVIQPCLSQRVTLSIWDQDLTSADELVGSIGVKWDSITDEISSIFQWFNVYGAPPNTEGEEAKIMNSNDKAASNWRGRLLMRMFVRDDPNPVKKKNKIESKELRILVHQTFEIENNYQVLAQVFEGVNLPKEDEEFSILIQLGQLKIHSKPAEASKFCCKWFESLKRSTIGVPESALIPDIFVYLLLDDSPICFARLKASECMDPNCKEKWIKMTPDKVIGKVENPWEGGYILMRIYIGLLDTPGVKLDAWKRPISIPQSSQSKKLVCNLYQCRSLPSADTDGLADPYVKIIVANSSISTNPKAKAGILNPMWYKQFALDLNYSSVDAAPPLIVQVWDYDAGLDNDDLMGYCVLDIQKIPQNPEDFPRPQWHKLGLGTPDTEEGEILMSFAVFDNKIPDFFLPVAIDINIEIYVLGLRDLKPALGWLPVNKPFLKIDLRGISYPGESQLITELKTQPSASGPNPNIGAVMSFKCKIPKDPLFCPSLSCNVYDYLLSGMSQPILGNFTIDLTTALNRSNSFQLKKIKRRTELDPPLLGHDKPSMVIMEKEEEKPLINIRKENTEDLPLIQKNPSNGIGLSLSEAQQPGQVVVMPQYKVSEIRKRVIEVKLQDNLYMPLGYNREPNDGNKHYRYMLGSEYEKSELVGVPPFQSYEIKKGQSRGLTRGFQLFGKKTQGGQDLSTISRAGVFKGLIRITHSNNRKSVDSKDLEDGFEQIAKLLVTKKDCLVRVYIIDALDLVQKDSDSASDPYLILKLGDKSISTRDNYISDNPCPKFFQCFDLNATFPGESTLKIQMWDYDSFLPDEKIGVTKIDLEDRYFSENWKSLPEYPIETRKLMIKSCKHPQGFIRMWVEIHPLYSNTKIWDISPKPPEKFEMRLIIWNCEGIPNADIEGVSDLYVVATVNGEDRRETDTHYRAQEGKASWNWRMKFNLLLTEDSRCLVDLQIWDRDLLSANDAIGGVTLDLTTEVRQALELDDTVKKFGKSDKALDRLSRKAHEKFLLDFETFTKDGTKKNVGKVLVSVEIMPDAKAVGCVNGEGRSEPNIEPTLPEPEGRIKLSLNPLTMLNQLIGPELKRKIYCTVICGLCCFLLAMMMPMIFSNVISLLLFS